MLVVIEKNYKISVWCREILDGLQREARKKRVSLTQSTFVEDIDRESEDSAIIIVGAETEWLNIAATRAINSGKHPIILSNQSEIDPRHGASCVTEDISGSMNEIMQLFAAKGLDRVALYAYNPDSASDSFKKEAFLRSGGSSRDVFINRGSLKACFDSFYKKHRENSYGGIVCTNDFAAISLIRHLNDMGESVKDTDIISYSNTIIARCTLPSVSTVKANFARFGQLAFMIVDCITKGDGIRGIRIFCDWKIIHRDTSSPWQTAPTKELPPPEIKPGGFYGDRELLEMMGIETLLSECDETDIEIINAILKGKKSLEIVESCFLTETAVKYRIRKMKEICRVESRAELKDILAKYISGDIDKLDAAP